MNQPNKSGAEVRCPKCGSVAVKSSQSHRFACPNGSCSEVTFFTPEPASEAAEGKETDYPRTLQEALPLLVSLQAQCEQLKRALSSGICSAHREPDPLHCDLCNQVKVLENANLARMETIEQLKRELTTARSDLKCVQEDAALTAENLRISLEDCRDKAINTRENLRADVLRLEKERDELRNILDSGKGQSAVSILWQEMDALKSRLQQVKEQLSMLPALIYEGYSLKAAERINEIVKRCQ